MYYLKKLGFLEGEAGNYSLTELGKKYAEIRTWDNGYGGYAARGYEYYTWDKKIISKLDTTSEHLEKIRNLTKQLRIERKLQAQKYIEIPNPELLNKQNLNTANNKSIYCRKSTKMIKQERLKNNLYRFLKYGTEYRRDKK